MIFVNHNPDKLPAYKLLKFRGNVQSAYKYLQRELTAKRTRGFKIRVVPDYERNCLELSANSMAIIEHARRFIHNGGFSFEVLNLDRRSEYFNNIEGIK
jgi:hypothetical protein